MTHSIVRRTLYCLANSSLLVILNTGSAPPILAASTTLASPALCLNASSIDLGDTHRGNGRWAGEPDCFRLQTPAAGLLMLDLAVPGTAVAEPRLSVLGSGCERSAGVELIESSASHLLILTRARQELTVCAGAQDPRHWLGRYKLRTAFLELGPGTHRAEEVEAEPDPLAGGHHRAEEVEAEPDPLAASDPLSALCRVQDLDDHSDSLLCATPVTFDRDIRGEIGNGWGDDLDVFVFELIAARTVRIETSGEADTFGGLYDRRGQRLATADGGGNGDNFRLVKTLQPGLYFVRVEAAAWSRGAYALAVSPIDSW